MTPRIITTKKLFNIKCEKENFSNLKELEKIAPGILLREGRTICIKLYILNMNPNKN